MPVPYKMKILLAKRSLYLLLKFDIRVDFYVPLLFIEGTGCFLYENKKCAVEFRFIESLARMIIVASEIILCSI